MGYNVELHNNAMRQEKGNKILQAAEIAKEADREIKICCSMYGSRSLFK